MQRMHPYAPWIILLLVILLARGFYLTPVLLLLMPAGGAYLLYQGLQVWRGEGGRFSARRETYWRGRRIELPARREAGLPALRSIGPALPYLISGAVIMLIALGTLFG